MISKRIKFRRLACLGLISLFSALPGLGATVSFAQEALKKETTHGGSTKDPLNLDSSIEKSADYQSAVFVAGEDGYHTYRIPSVIATQTGKLLAFCEGRKSGQSDTGDIDLLMKHSTDQGKTWSKMKVIWDDDKNTCGNPCAVVNSSGDIVLLLTWNSGKVHESKIKSGFGEDSRRVFVTRSSDDGVTWQQPHNITLETKREDWSWYATGPGSGIEIANGDKKGRLVIPCDHKVRQNGNLEYHSHVIYSDDGGKTWQLGGDAGKQVNECEVVELVGGKLMLNMRNYNRKQRCRQVSFSDDGGESWYGQKHDIELIEPICQASIHRIRWPVNEQPGVILFSNPASESKRENMMVRASTDDGATWKSLAVLHQGSAAYSSLCRLSDQSAGCLYEKDGYKKIVFAKFAVD